MMIEPSLIKIDGFNGLEGKVVQLYLNDTPILAVGNKNKLNHGTILDAVLEIYKIPYNKVGLFDRTMHAEIKGDQYQAVGMGYGIFEDDTIFLHGSSIGYRVYGDKMVGIDKDHITKVQPYIKDLEIFCKP
jgi:hypothetical protein